MRKTHKLLAVVMLIGSAQASAQPVAEQELVEATAEVRMREYYGLDAVARFITTPRRLASGAPACGNVGGKPMPLPCTAEYADQLAAIRHAEMLATVALAHAARTRLQAARRLAEVSPDAPAPNRAAGPSERT